MQLHILTFAFQTQFGAQEGVSGILIGVIVGVASLAGIALLALLVFLGVLVYETVVNHRQPMKPMQSRQ